MKKLLIFSLLLTAGGTSYATTISWANNMSPAAPGVVNLGVTSKSILDATNTFSLLVTSLDITNMPVTAALGAIGACIAVAVTAALLNRPLSRVPENSLKFAVGVMVSAFGLFWFGEGIGIHWRYGDATILALMAVLLVASSVGVRMSRR